VSSSADSAVGADSLAAPGGAPLPEDMQRKCQKTKTNEKQGFFSGSPADGRATCKKV
jgi:hypothetical protein